MKLLIIYEPLEVNVEFYACIGFMACTNNTNKNVKSQHTHIMGGKRYHRRYASHIVAVTHII